MTAGMLFFSASCIMLLAPVSPDADAAESADLDTTTSLESLSAPRTCFTPSVRFPSLEASFRDFSSALFTGRITRAGDL